MDRRTLLFRKWYYYLYLALAFAIPLYDRLVVLMIILLFILWVAEGRFKERFRRAWQEKERRIILSFSILYIVYALGLIYSGNLEYGLFDMQVKLSLLIFPLFLATSPEGFLSQKQILHISYSFIFSCIIITLIALVLATQNYLYSHTFIEYYYDNLSDFQHPSYFSMNLNFAISLIIILLIRMWTSLARGFRTFLIILIPYFFTMVILLASKAGIISLLILLLVSLASLILYKKEYVIGLIFVLLVPFAFVGAYYLFPSSFYRLTIAKNYLDGHTPLNLDSGDGTNDRILVWRSSVEVFREHPVCGVGTGDVKDVLMEKYRENQILAAMTKRLNAHNQYLQTLVALGLIGLLILSLMLLLPAISAIRKNNLLYLLFLLLVGINFLGESMLERQAGVVFYSFFNTLLLYIHIRKQ
ncbi:MAG TPA: O-antigen ligase family protein [Bacteroidales bacterium]|nr:O-antigen ligase family protein [Bacteroidales bacterium]HSA43527.1 O-antigen ligase family protein [Bacteroidales bacterium]